MAWPVAFQTVFERVLAGGSPRHWICVLWGRVGIVGCGAVAKATRLRRSAMEQPQSQGGFPCPRTQKAQSAGGCNDVEPAGPDRDMLKVLRHSARLPCKGTLCTSSTRGDDLFIAVGFEETPLPTKPRCSV